MNRFNAFRHGMGMMVEMRTAISVLLAGMLLVGCTLQPTQQSAPPDDPVISIAERQVGKPYHYGGHSPRSGFDCSGLVWYAYSQAGFEVPRTTAAQFAATHPVGQTGLLPGHVLFFRIDGKPSHVGIYAGKGRFLHAPSSGKHVSYESLSNPYWQARLIKAGRFR
ncbi:C40 family peptidase [Thiohalomonas denitrificans]|uniref:NlpC/P60 family protein n=1 Tax=Thiohalomonas denitrificans TaxID=415747 RepID=A0A1G5PS38_9GAMM|nr:C40 family peptidase [Thiohalomonas denitrificans]SCZ52168.1 NlpC/P60 family protein [Thiohalomonas denitrificans]